MDNRSNQMSAQIQGTLDAARQEYQALSEKAAGQSTELAKMLSNAGASFDNIKRETDSQWKDAREIRSKQSSNAGHDQEASRDHVSSAHGESTRE